MDGSDRDRLTRLLGTPELAWVLDRVRKRLEGGRPLDGTVTLSGASAAQRAAVHRLLGRPARHGETLSVALAAVDELLRRSGAAPGGLAAATVELTGPVTDRTTTQAERERAWHEALGPLDGVVVDRSALTEWYASIRETGMLRRLTGTPEAARPILAELAEVIRNLPASSEPLGRFAARVTGSAHALDDNRPLSTLTLGAARALSGLPAGAGAQWRREVWASVGLLRDEVSSTVLTLGLLGDDRTPTGRALACWRDAGQPVVLTLRQLVRDPPIRSAPLVSVCENPVVVSSAADRLGAAASPLICTNGQPGAAAMHLLRCLAGAGAELRYHGDFDWGGIRIGNVLFDRLPVRPWRFDTATYTAAAARGRRLTGIPVAARWDEHLAEAMREHEKAVEEELLLDDLLTDLVAGCAPV